MASQAIIANQRSAGGGASSIIDGKNFEEAREVLGIPVGGKLLWYGEWTEGTITVPNTEKFTLFLIKHASAATVIPAMRIHHGASSFIRGLGGYSSAYPTITYYQFAATNDGDTWTFVACNSLVMYGDTKDKLTSLSVNEIWGVV